MAVKGIPVVIASRGLGFPVNPVDAGAPLMEIASNDIGAPITLTRNGAPFIVPGLPEFNWQPLSMTAGTDGVQWIGFSNGDATLPQPAFGSISGEPSALTTLLGLYDDTNSGVYLAVFSGDWLKYMHELPLTIGGITIRPFDGEVISGNTWLRYNGLGDLADGQNYEILFG